jgi:hypothetical protein
MKDLKGLVARMRDEFLDDTTGAETGDSKWSTPNLVSALNSSERELCRKLFLLSESTTPDICQVAITLVNGVYPRSFSISDKIVRIERLKYPGVTKPLLQKTIQHFDDKDPGWDEMSGVPTMYAVDFESFTVTFNRQPVAVGTVKMGVKRLPLNDLSEVNMAAFPEIRQYEDELIHGALKWAYLKDDSRTFDPVRAGVWKKTFDDDIARITQDKAAMNPQEHICRAERF